MHSVQTCKDTHFFRNNAIFFKQNRKLPFTPIQINIYLDL